jgi:formate transporter
LVVVAGAELFTGNNLLVLAWVGRRISSTELVRHLVLVYLANAVGAGGLVLLVMLSNHWQMNGDAIGREAVMIAATKVSLPLGEAFFKGILCNVLVCLAVWLAMAGRTVVDKVVAVVFPISAFVAAGFEHSVANMYFIPLGILLKSRVHTSGIDGLDHLNWTGLIRNLAPVTAGNLVGGGVMVALVYYVIYLRGEER